MMMMRLTSFPVEEHIVINIISITTAADCYTAESVWVKVQRGLRIVVVRVRAGKKK